MLVINNLYASVTGAENREEDVPLIFSHNRKYLKKQRSVNSNYNRSSIEIVLTYYYVKKGLFKKCYIYDEYLEDYKK